MADYLSCVLPEDCSGAPLTPLLPFGAVFIALHIRLCLLTLVSLHVGRFVCCHGRCAAMVEFCFLDNEASQQVTEFRCMLPFGFVAKWLCLVAGLLLHRASSSESSMHAKAARSRPPRLVLVSRHTLATRLASCHLKPPSLGITCNFQRVLWVHVVASVKTTCQDMPKRNVSAACN